MKLTSANINPDGSWSLVVETANQSRAVEISSQIAALLTSSTAVENYLLGLYPPQTLPTHVSDLVGTSW